MLRQLPGQHQPHRRLNLPTAQRSLLIISTQLPRLTRNPLKDIINKGVHDGHALLGDAGVGMDLFEDLVDVGGVAFDALFGTFLFVAGGFFGGFGGGLFGGCFGHGCFVVLEGEGDCC